MKKILAMLLLVSLLFGLCSCGASSSDDDVKGTIEENTTEEVTTEAEDTTEAEEDYEINLAEGGTYKNEYFGFGCTLDEEWTFATEEEILAMNELTGELVGEEMKEAIANADILYELSASKNGGLESININIENPGVLALGYTDETYLKSQQDNLKETLESIGLADVTVSTEEIEFAGGTHWAIKVSADMNGTQFDEYVITIKRGTRFANISIGAYGSDINSILGCFFAVEG